ncbi:quinate 5-dehydrogenase, partial [bacterium CPR1]|nr:quinate 5-dehydrogenase [bacterium CPR1]
ITSLEELESYARKLLPEICKLPISLVYPIGKKQSEIRPDSLTGPYYQEAEVLAGDFHFIRRRMPDRLEGKTVLTNTVTARDVQELHNRGVHWLVTTTPELSGRSFGTNVLEAALVALGGDYAELTTRLGLKPRVVDLREVPPSTA